MVDWRWPRGPPRLILPHRLARLRVRRLARARVARARQERIRIKPLRSRDSVIEKQATTGTRTRSATISASARLRRQTSPAIWVHESFWSRKPRASGTHADRRTAPEWPPWVTSATIRVTRRDSPARFTVSPKRSPHRLEFQPARTFRSFSTLSNEGHWSRALAAQSDVPATASPRAYDRAISGRWDRRCGGVATPSGGHRR